MYLIMVKQIINIFMIFFKIYKTRNLYLKCFYKTFIKDIDGLVEENKKNWDIS